MVGVYNDPEGKNVFDRSRPTNSLNRPRTDNDVNDGAKNGLELTSVDGKNNTTL